LRLAAPCHRCSDTTGAAIGKIFLLLQGRGRLDVLSSGPHPPPHYPMNDADADYELRRMFLGFGGAFALFLLLYVARTVKIYFLGRHVDAVVAKVLKREPEGSRGGTHKRKIQTLQFATTDKPNQKL